MRMPRLLRSEGSPYTEVVLREHAELGVCLTIESAASWFGNASTGELVRGAQSPGFDWVKVCSQCIYDHRVGGITFGSNGVCSYCRQVDELSAVYGTGSAAGEGKLEERLQQIRSDGRGRPFDCIIGVSGGTDSSYLIRMATRQWGLRPLAVHYDNTWNTATASQNIAEVLSTYQVPLYTYVVSHLQADRIFRAFFLIGVPELDASTDLGYAYTLRKVASQYRVRHILEGHSFTTEGVSPLTNNYFDGKYIQSVVNEAAQNNLIGSEPKVARANEYPLMTLARFLGHAAFRKAKFTRPLWFMDYTKEAAKEVLARESGWRDYGGHHLENRMTAFFHSLYMPKKFGVDFRNNSLSAACRQGIVSREEAWARYCKEPYIEDGLRSYFQMRLGISNKLFEDTMKADGRSWNEFDTYKRDFERLAPIFRFLAKRDRVTMSFYLKYCQK